MVQVAKNIVLAVAIVGLLTGCETLPNSSASQDTVYATYRVVQRLDKNLGGSVTKLNETTADLSVRLDEYDRHARRLQGLVEENQVRIQTVESKLDELMLTMYRNFDWSPPRWLRTYDSSPSMSTGEVTVTPPLVAPAPPTEAPKVTPYPDATSPASSLTPSSPTAPPPPAAQETSVASDTPRVAVAPRSPVEDYNAARDSYLNGDFDLALEQYDAFLVRYPETEWSDNSQFWKAQCYVKLRQLEKAITEFGTLRAKYPTSDKVPTAMYQEAAALSNLGRNGEAITLIRKLLEDYPMHPATEGAKQKLKLLEGR